MTDVRERKREKERKRTCSGSGKRLTVPTADSPFEFKRETPKSQPHRPYALLLQELTGRCCAGICAERIPKADRRAAGPFVKVRQETGGILVRSSLAGGAIN